MAGTAQKEGLVLFGAGVCWSAYRRVFRNWGGRRAQITEAQRSRMFMIVLGLIDTDINVEFLNKCLLHNYIPVRKC